MATNRISDVIQHLRGAVILYDRAGLADGQLLADYVSRHDDTALELLVRRHGPMVWGVCRRVLGNYHDAEDAFQTTFLVFIRKAAAIASRELLANWLYGVAHQTALKARATSAKRGIREKQVTVMPEPALEQVRWTALPPLLDQELSRLPDKYRAVVVLCDLDGKSRKDAARQLAVPAGTVASRLATGRAMLAKRLALRGVGLPGGALAVVLSENAASAGMPTAVVTSTIQAAKLFAAGHAAAAGAISPKVAALTEGMLNIMLLSKIKTMTAALVVAVVVLLGIGVGVMKAPAAVEEHTGGLVSADDKQEAKVKWESKAITTDRIEQLAPKKSKDRLTDGLNTLGEQGWEFVALQAQTKMMQMNKDSIYLFKRQR
jgi:RNA polymerase sigma factor (sigma-70 family)